MSSIEHLQFDHVCTQTHQMKIFLCIVSFARFIASFDALTPTFHVIFLRKILKSIVGLLFRFNVDRTCRSSREILHMTEHQHHSELDQIRQHNSEYQLIVQT